MIVSPHGFWLARTVVVLGASGFLGTHLAAELVKRGAEVHGLSRVDRRGRARGIRWWRSDPAKLDDLRSVLLQIRPDVIFHLSSLANGGKQMSLVLPTFESEVVATVNVLTQAAELDVGRVVLAGSMEEPGPGDSPTMPYAAAKMASHCYAQLFRDLYGLPVVVPRIFMTYGPGQPTWKVIPHSVQALLRGQRPEIKSPDRLVDWIYVSDVIAGLLRAAEAPGPPVHSFDLGSGTLVSVGEVTQRLDALVNGGPRAGGVRTHGQGPARETVRRADVATTSALIDWRPMVSLEEGLRFTVDDMRRRA